MLAPDGLMMTVIGPLLTLALILVLRLRLPAAEKPLSAGFLWLAPSLYLAAVAFMLVRHPPTLLGWSLVIAGLVIGGAAGWVRGRLFTLRVDPESGTVLRRRSRWAISLLIGIVSLRFVANLWVGPITGSMPSSAAALLVTDLTMGLVFGLLVATRVEIALRARRLLAEALR